MRSETTAKPISEAIVSGLLRLVDAASTLLVGGVAFYIWVHSRAEDKWPAYALVILLGALLTVNLLHIAGAYRFANLTSARSALARAAVGWVGVTAMLLAISFLSKSSTEFSRAWSLMWCLGGFVMIAATRLVLVAWIAQWREQGRLSKSVAVIGAGPIGQRLLRHLSAHPDHGLKVVGVYDDRMERLPARCMGHPIVGNLDRLLSDARERSIDMAIVALPLSADWRLARLVEKLRLLPIDVRLCPDQFAFRLRSCEVSEVNGLTMLNVLDRPFRDWRMVVKAVEDRILAALILALIAPVLLAIAIGIKLDSPGPVLFRQRRYGFNNQLIEVFKFRTMYHDKRDADATQLTRRNDPRVTRFGAFLRRTSLDELPQFFNVLRGEMSIVGPRPHAVAAKAGGLLYQEAVVQYAARHRVKPGITGWAQVNGWRGETEVLHQIEQRVEHDLYYIEHWSLGFDLRIILKTVLGGFSGRYAY